MKKSDLPASVTSSMESGTTFLANTLHEIRTPLQTIISTLELLSTTSLDKEQTEYVRQINFSADIMLTLANDILDFSKIRSKAFNLESIPYELSELVEHVMDLISIEAFNKGLEIVADVDNNIPLLQGDPTRVQQIILNILKNAVKFTAKGYVYLSAKINDNNEILISISDSGIGIPEKSRESLFKDFYQAEASTTRKYGGTGLGLSICKTLVQAMSGSIGVNENPSGGSIFWFTLPLVKASETRKNEASFSKAMCATKILLVDDSDLACSSFKHHIETLGFQNINTVSSGEDAISELKKASEKNNPYEIVFIDMLMPKIDGWHLASDINFEKTISKPKLFLIIPEGQMGGEAKMKLLNWFNGYLYKPIKKEKFSEILHQAFAENQDNIESLEPLEPAETIPQQTEKVAEKMHILVVEDHPVNRKLLVTFIQKFGATAYQAENGEEAVNIVKQNPNIDLVFMDIQLPILSGVEATVKIRQNNFNGIIVACTANNDNDDFEHYKNAGMDDVLAKPFKSIAIKEIIEKWKKTILSNSKNQIIKQNQDQNKKIEKSRTISKTTTWNKIEFFEIIGGDKKLGKTLLNDYEIQTSKLLKEIPDFLSCKDFKEIRRIGHTLKGSSATLAIENLASLAERINIDAKNENQSAIVKISNAFSKEFEIFKTQAKEWIKENV